MLLFALVGATVGNAQTIAESPTKISELTSGYYVIKNVNSAKGDRYVYLANETIGQAIKVKKTAPTTENTSDLLKYLWYVNVESSNKVTIASVNQLGYWQKPETLNRNLVDEKITFDLTTANQTNGGNTSTMTEDMISGGATCLIRNNNAQSFYFHMNGGASDEECPLASWNDCNPQSLLYAQFYAIDNIEDIQTTFNITLNYTDTETSNTFTKTYSNLIHFGGTTIPINYKHVSPTFYTINSATNADDDTEVTSFSTTGTYNVSVTSNFPFEVMTITDGAFANANFYTMLNDNNNKDVVYNSDTHIHTLTGIKGFNKESLWAFELVEGTEANFRIYNLSLGAGQCIYKDGTGTGAVAMGSTSSTSNTKFTLYKNGTGYGFFIPGATTACLNASANQNGEGANSSLGIWNDGGSPTDGGSRFFFTSVDKMTELAQTLLIAADETYPASEGYLAVTNAEDAYYLVNFHNDQTLAKLNTALESVSETFNYNNPYYVSLDPSKVYQIISYNDANCKGQTIYSDTWCGPNGGNGQFDDRKILIGANRPIGETLFWFESVSNGYRIHHANSDYRFVELSAFGDMQTPDMPVAIDAGGTYIISPATYLTNVFALSNYNTENKWLHCGTGNGKTIVRNQAPAANDGDLWLIKEVQNIPVTIGAAKWSTLCLPVAVTVPNDESLKVYTVSDVDNGTGVMTLNEVAAGTVVAKKTGLLLASTSENASDTYNFTVSTEAGTSYNNNILMGTTARRKGFNTADGSDPTAITIPHYALAQQDGVVAFYPSTLNILPANKAYIKKADITTTGGDTNRALYMTGETTGMNNALIQNGETEEYYDLNGRRVLYPTTGIYATRSGKKVFIK